MELSTCPIIVVIAMLMLTFTATQTHQACPAATTMAENYAADSNEARLADATTGFAINFINSLASKSKENVVISPLSLMNVLNMLLLGSDDNSPTQQELFTVLGYKNSSLSDGRLKPHEAARNICIVDDQAANQQQAVNYTLANLLLVNRDLIDLKEDYAKELSTYYKVKVDSFSRTSTNVSKDAKPLHDRVNDWVKDQTKNQIEKMADESDLNGNDLVMVLLNAAYFKARWLHTFNPKSTLDRTFYNLGKETVDVKFMSQKGVFGYADFNTNAPQVDVAMASDSKTKTTDDDETILTEDVPTVTPVAAAASGSNSSSATTAATATTEKVKPVATSVEPAAAQPPTIELSKDEARRLELTSKLNCSALMLPFSLNDGQDLSMVILLPARRDGLGELVANLNAQSLNEIYRSLTEQRVKIELPKFNFESSHDAKQTLKLMGLHAIFKESANLGRMYQLSGSATTTTNSSSPAAATNATTGTGPVRVDKVIHKVKIGVDESGAEAAAASMVTLDLRNFVRPAIPSFIADHPFLFVIRHNKSNMPLFMGQVNRL